MATGDPQYNPPVTQNVDAESFRARAVSVLGTDDLAVYVDDFAAAMSTAGGGSWIYWTAVLANGGTADTNNADANHCGRFKTTIAVSGVAQIRALQNTLVTNIKTQKWYLATRTKVATAIDAQAKAFVGLVDGALSGTVNVGVLGNLSTVNYIIQYDGVDAGTTLSLGVAIDTAFHIFEMWGAGDNKIYGCVDGGATVSATMTNGPDARPRMGVTNGTTAAIRSMDVDWVLYAAGRTT